MVTVKIDCEYYTQLRDKRQVPPCLVGRDALNWAALYKDKHKDYTVMAEQDPATQASELPINLVAQYVRDLSFENPLAPESMKMQGAQPQMDVNIGLDARKMPEEDGLFEVILSVRARALVGEDVLFVCEVQYGILTKIDDSVPQESHHPLVFIEVPRQAFPFVRQIVSNAVSNGGFPPLYLAPVDFHKLYLERFKDEIEASKQAATAPVEGNA